VSRKAGKGRGKGAFSWQRDVCTLKLRDFYVIYESGYDRESPSLPCRYKRAMQCPLLVVVGLGAKREKMI
jgi:hypothetical protein